MDLLNIYHRYLPRLPTPNPGWYRVLHERRLEHLGEVVGAEHPLQERRRHPNPGIQHRFLQQLYRPRFRLVVSVGG